MALALKRLADIQNIPASAGAVFTNPAGKVSYAKNIVIYNGNTTVETVKLYRVPDNAGAVGTPSDTGNCFFNQNVSPNQTFFIEFPGQGIVLEDTNDTIFGVTTTANKVTMSIDGGQK